MIRPYVGPRAPQVDKIWVVVPFRRKGFRERVLENFARQRFAGKRLLLVVNGPAIGLKDLPGDAVVIESREHQSIAKNEALAYIRKQGGGFFATMDDDDWYGPGYLDELAGYARTYDVLGKCWHFVSLGEGYQRPEPQLILCNRRYADQDSRWLTGGTLSGWAESVPDFPVLKDAEDLAWCARLVQQGARLRALSIYHYLYRRSYLGAEHTWRQSREAFVRSVRAHEPLEFPLARDGQIDLDIVSAEKAPTATRLIGEERFKPIAKSPQTALDPPG